MILELLDRNSAWSRRLARVRHSVRHCCPAMRRLFRSDGRSTALLENPPVRLPMPRPLMQPEWRHTPIIHSLQLSGQDVQLLKWDSGTEGPVRHVVFRAVCEVFRKLEAAGQSCNKKFIRY